MAANIPSPIMGGGRSRQDPGQALLLALAQQLMGGLAQTGLERAFPAPALQQRQQLIDEQSAEKFAERSVATKQLAGSATPAGTSFRQELGDARVDTGSLTRSAPLRAQQAALEDKAAARAEALASARRSLRQVAGDNAATLESLFNFSVGAGEAGIDASTINAIIRPALPVDAATELGLQETRLKIIDAENAQLADGFATAELARQGVLPPDTPVIPGASKTLLTIVDAREGKKPNWMQEAVNYVTSRVGEAAGGTGGGVQIVDGQLSTGGPPPVTVEQATNEFRDIVTRLAPASERDRVLTLLNSNTTQRQITRSITLQEIVANVRSGVPQEMIRESLQDFYNKAEIDALMRDATAAARSLP